MNDNPDDVGVKDVKMSCAKTDEHEALWCATIPLSPAHLVSRGNREIHRVATLCNSCQLRLLPWVCPAAIHAV